MNTSRRPIAAIAVIAALSACGGQAPAPAQTEAAASDGPLGALPDDLGFRADPDRMREHLDALQAIADANGGIRFAGTDGYEASVDYAAGALRELGWDVSTPEVPFTGFRELPGGTLEVGGRTFAAPDDLHTLIYSAGGDVEGPLVELSASGCDAGDFAEVDSGDVVLTTEGGCFRRQQALNAVDAGAAALIVGYVDRGPGEIFRPTLIDPAGIDIPVVSVTAEAVEALRASPGDDVRLAVDTEREPSTVRNVVAQLGDGERVVMLGAHLDSVLEGPGINDNGSGVAALLEIARALAADGVPDGTAVRIGLWGAEELGTVGSRAYVESIEDEPVAYLNLDMAGSVNGLTLVYDDSGAAPGSEAITDAYITWLEARGEESHAVDLSGSSDHVGFQQAGIPTGGLFSGATDSGSAAQPAASADGEPAPDPCYHLACDTVENVDLERVALFAEATHAVTLALLGG
jgi:Zn-dependent M28 family amino/carboxypeptidase